MPHPIHQRHPNQKIFLGSGSPRRKQLLEGLGLTFEIIVSDIDESYSNRLQAEQIPLFLAKKKALALKGQLPSNSLLITADTIVWKDNVALNKPKHAEEAIEMLNKLSGAAHEVYTGTCFLAEDSIEMISAKTEVVFKKLSEAEISYYVETYKPFDKAGAYGAQEWLGYVAIEKLNGSYFNVMGLPVHEVQHYLLKNFELE